MKPSRLSQTVLAGLLAIAMTPLSANPPAQAPAHGWRLQHDPYYLGYTGQRWERDYGIVAGRCNRDAVGAVLGGMVGDAVGSPIGKGDGKTVAIVVGAVLGARIAGDLDRSDAACIGHALELARDGQRVSWRDDAGKRYQLKPLRGFDRDGLPCRSFQLGVAGKHVERRACQREAGMWEMVD